MKTFMGYLTFHHEEMVGINIERVHILVRTESHADAFRALLNMKDHRFSELLLKDINIYERS